MHPQIHPNQKPKSAARLSAEAAFFATPGERMAAMQAPAPVVTVLNRRLVALPTTPQPQPDTGPQPSSAGPADAAASELAKASRVFLVRPTLAETASDSAPAAPRSPMAQDPSDLAFSQWRRTVEETTTAAPLTQPKPLKLSRRKRQLAPPVKVIYSADPATLAARVATRDAVLSEPPAQGMANFAAALAEIDATFEIIRKAMAFEVTDPAFAAEWERLSQTADSIADQCLAFAAMPMPPSVTDLVEGRA